MATPVTYDLTTQWPATDQPLKVTYDNGVYYVSTGYFAQTPGTYSYKYYVTGTNWFPLVAIGEGENDDVITFSFKGDNSSYYNIYMSCHDDYYDTDVSGQVGFHSLENSTTSSTDNTTDNSTLDTATVNSFIASNSASSN